MEKKAIVDPVRLRDKEISGGRKSLYLDIYLNGKRRYEFLKLYLVPENTRADKAKNKETLALAESVRAKKLVEFQTNRFGFENACKNASKISFADYFEKYANDKYNEGSIVFNTKIIYNNVTKYIRAFDEKTKLADVDEDWIEDLIGYIKPNVSSGTIKEYYHKLSACLKNAYIDKLITENPCSRVATPRGRHKERCYLTVEELKMLSACEFPGKTQDTKRAFLFCCLTGFRYSDVSQLKWNDVNDDANMSRIVIRQQKTKELIYQDINKDARLLLGERKNGTDKVFSLYSPMNINGKLKVWMKAAGIDKDISFHCSRHTFAVLLLDNDTDIYTVSKLLGHTSVKTTEIYAHILDKKKQAAVNNLPSFLD